jgi:hypothetical protein
MEPEFADQAKLMRSDKEGALLLLDFAHVFAELLDLMISEENTYLTVGCAKDGSKIICTFHEGNITRYANGVDLRSLLTEFDTL